MHLSQSPPSRAENSPALDLAHLARVIGCVDYQQICELIDIFTFSAHDELQICHQLLSACDLDKLSLSMHKLKSSAALVGALTFEDIAQRLENATNSKALDTASQLLVELEQALAEVEKSSLALRHSSVLAGELFEDDILNGIRNDEFDVYFQPLWNAGTIEFTGVEALLHWKRNDLLVTPELFLTHAAQNTLSDILAELFITKALIGGSCLAEANHTVSVSIKLFSGCLGNMRLPDFILASTQAIGLKPAQITLEIAAKTVKPESPSIVNIMQRLQKLGFKLCLGYVDTAEPDINEWLYFPFYELKLAPDLIKRASDQQETRTKLISNISCAKLLNLTVVATGIKTQDQLDVVRNLGCDLVQGDLFAAAFPLEELLNWLKAYYA